MRKKHKRLIKKVTRYTSLTISIFILASLVGMFVAGNYNVLSWQPAGRAAIVMITFCVVCVAVIISESPH